MFVGEEPNDITDKMLGDLSSINCVSASKDNKDSSGIFSARTNEKDESSTSYYVRDNV